MLQAARPRAVRLLVSSEVVGYVRRIGNPALRLRRRLSVFTGLVQASIARGIMKQIRVHILCTLIFYMHIFLNEKTSHIWNAFLPKHLGGRHYSRLTPSCTVQMNYLVFFLTASMVAVFPPVGNLMC